MGLNLSYANKSQKDNHHGPLLPLRRASSSQKSQANRVESEAGGSDQDKSPKQGKPIVPPLNLQRLPSSQSNDAVAVDKPLEELIQVETEGMMGTPGGGAMGHAEHRLKDLDISFSDRLDDSHLQH
mmetsp:Transcript_24250/g.32511  ORF Transcript_24250/g.32511 Transcript_24250/m.32511 type:complete len:126 (-) Transcript_24250:715-1092(-)|eukprot:CAMPEP_0185576366 /NCGR_PEP_ID=MMETSP0434-20130131/7311_1 /TAXON_ID=626734 ORGANISM="Favella taraikaensis, Strain Fe Narragansett Bay" /NCGR_SAMPLE_ID=MMETSP0434 /ASSEMBLY_ACC=CAM_ASM_000379 /LENGTH=125 /DNA_ID=CAMNT_0028193543 /DNA_START=2133 /DNA_END=2510 /DNA_ORIENTATION=+